MNQLAPNGRPYCKIVVVLQSAWMPDKARAERLERFMKDHRLGYEIHLNLTLNTKTGQRLQDIFHGHRNFHERGEIYVGNTTQTVGVGSSSCPPIDLDHCREFLAVEKPGLVLACGKPAAEAMKAVCDVPVVTMPHPAARFLSQRSLIFPEVRRVLFEEPEPYAGWVINQHRDGFLISEKVAADLWTEMPA